MALSDATMSDSPAVGVEVKAEPIDAKAMKRHAAAALLKAIEAKDVNAVEDALDMHYAACEADEGAYDDEGSEEKE